MLQAIRDRAQGIFAWVLLILIGVPFALWGIQNYFSSGKEIPLAVVGDRDIFERDVKPVYEQMVANLGGVAQFDDKVFRRQALERVIGEELMEQAAREKRLVVSDEEVRTLIQTLAQFQTDGVFDKERYKVMLSSQNLSPGQYNERVRRALTMEQYQRGVSDSVVVTRQQIEDLYRLKNQQREIEYVTLPLRKAEESIPEAAVTTYYNLHRAEFQEPETVTVDYVLLTLDTLAETVKPGEDELRALYDAQKAAFTTKEQRRVRHILIAAGAGDAEADKSALAKIEAVRDRLEKREDFAKLAQEVSEDPVSAPQGGDLGVLTAGTMDPSFEKAAMALTKGAISEPVRTPFGYHLIQVVELSPGSVKSFDEVRPELVKMFQRNAADSRFYELGQKLTELAFEHPNSLEPAAKAIGKAIERSRPFTREKGEGIAAEPAVRGAAFSEDVLNGKNSDLIELSPDRVVVLRAYDHRPATERPLEQVRNEILQRMRAERAEQETARAAEELRAKLESGATLASLAKGEHLAVSSPPPFRRDATNLPPAVVNAVFRAPRPRDTQPVTGVAALGDGSQAVYVLKSVVEPSPPPAGDKEVETLRDYLANAAGQSQFAAWLEELRATQDVHVTSAKD